MRLYKSVRLSSVTSIWVDELIADKQEILDKELQKGLVEDAEACLLKEFPYLNGISRNISFKISFSSIVEMCYRNTKKFSIADWEEVALRMEADKTTSSKTSNTPKLYLEDFIWEGLEDYQRDLMGEDNKRILRLSYIIKLVLFAGLEEHRKTKDKIKL